MNKIRKKLTTLGTISIASIPIISVASCGVSKISNNSEISNNKDLMKAISHIKNKSLFNSDSFTPIKHTQTTTIENFLQENRKIKQGEKIEVKDDVVVLSDAYYSGKIQDISKIYEQIIPGAFKNMESDTPFKYINGSAILPGWGDKFDDWRSWKPVIELGANDSLLYIFDDDDKDGRSLKEFKKQIMFEDTSIVGDKQITELNKLIGLKKGPYGSYSRVPFIGNLNQGVLTPYFGSQNNHEIPSSGSSNIETNEHMRSRLEKVFPRLVVDTIINYYKTASKAFKPTELPSGYIKYKVVGPNAIRVDFSNNPLVTAAHLGKVWKNGKKHFWDAELSLGSKAEWDKYNKYEISSTENKYMIIGKH